MYNRAIRKSRITKNLCFLCDVKANELSKVLKQFSASKNKLVNWTTVVLD